MLTPQTVYCVIVTWLFNCIIIFYYYFCNRPLNLKSIRNQIHVGSIRSIGDIQRNLMVLSYNNVMLNRSSSTNFSDTSKFQEKVFSNMNVGV